MFNISVLPDVQANLPETSPFFACPNVFGDHLFSNVFSTWDFDLGISVSKFIHIWSSLIPNLVSVTPYLFLLLALCIEIRILIKKLFQPIVYLNSSSTEKWQTKTRSNLLLRLTHFTCQLRIGPKKIFTLDWSFVTIIFTVHIVMDKKWFITTTKNDLRSEENVKKWRSVILVKIVFKFKSCELLAIYFHEKNNLKFSRICKPIWEWGSCLFICYCFCCQNNWNGSKNKWKFVKIPNLFFVKTSGEQLISCKKWTQFWSHGRPISKTTNFIIC